MGAVEHLKTLCCLGLPPESAMVAVTPLLHEVIPHGWTRMALLESDATIGNSYAEYPGAAALYREHLWRFMRDPSSPMALWNPSFHANGIGWTLHMQGRGWTDTGWYRVIEAPLDSCWLLDAMVGDGERTIAHVKLSRPHAARPFTAWQDQMGTTGTPMVSGEMILTAEGKVVFQTTSLEYLLRILAREPGNYTHYVPVRDDLPLPILKLLRRVVGAANGSLADPPRLEVPTAYGILALEAKWLVPAGAAPADVAKDPKSCLIAVTIKLYEHAISHAVRILRESGATAAQVGIGIPLALGKTRPAIADELGMQLSSVADQAKRLYQTLGVHSSAEFGTKIWLTEKPRKTRQFRPPGCRRQPCFVPS